MNERKVYRKSDKCHIVYTPVSWNILDSEQLMDLEFVETSTNKAKKIRDCVRICRTGQMTIISASNLPSGGENILEQYNSLSESDIIDGLID